MTRGRYLLRTLRGRLVLALLAATVVGLFVMGATSLALLHRTLLERVDDRLVDMAHPLREGHHPPPMPPPDSRDQRELPTDFRLIFFDSPGNVSVVGATENDPRYPLVDTGILHEPRLTVPDGTGNADWRVHTVLLPSGETIAIALSLDDVQSTVQGLLTIELLVGAVVLIVLATVATLTVRLGLRPLHRIEHTANAIAGGDLHRRIADQDTHTETGRLGTALNTMLSRLVAALEERERSEQRLRRFAADASHELRTPLTSIRGFAELYRRSNAPPESEVRSMMARIEGEALRMTSLVEDLLMLVRLDRERSVDVTDLDLVPLVSDAVHDARVRDPEREITLEAESSVRVLGDSARLEQVLTNLLTNALVHTRRGAPVTVRVGHGVPGPEPMAATGVSLPFRMGSDSFPMGVVEVADGGPGIPAEHAARVFDRFYQVSDGRSDGGTGLGLAIAAAVTEAHNGRLELHSNAAEGSTFRLLLPLT